MDKPGIGIHIAAKRFGVTQQALLDAIRRGVLPAFTVSRLELRLRPKDVERYVASIAEWRRQAGKRGAAKKWARYRAARARAVADAAPRQSA